MSHWGQLRVTVSLSADRWETLASARGGRQQRDGASGTAGVGTTHARRARGTRLVPGRRRARPARPLDQAARRRRGVAAELEALGVRHLPGRLLPAARREDLRHRHHAFFPQEGRRNGDAEVLAVSGADTSGDRLPPPRLRPERRHPRSSCGSPSTDSAASTHTCRPRPCASKASSGYAGITDLLDGRLTLAEHREVLNLAGWLALLVGCVEYDMGMRGAAEATRQSAMSSGHRSRQRRDHRLGPRDGRLVRPHPRRLPRRHHRQRSRPRSSRRSQRRRPARRPESQSVGAPGRPPPGRSRPRPRPQPPRVAALPVQPRQPFRGRPIQVRLLRNGLLPHRRRRPTRRDLRSAR